MLVLFKRTDSYVSAFRSVSLHMSQTVFSFQNSGLKPPQNLFVSRQLWTTRVLYWTNSANTKVGWPCKQYVLLHTKSYTSIFPFCIHFVCTKEIQKRTTLQHTLFTESFPQKSWRHPLIAQKILTIRKFQLSKSRFSKFHGITISCTYLRHPRVMERMGRLPWEKL